MKTVLDPCCGSKMMWFDKTNENVMYGDIREESHILCDGRVLEVSPDMIIDFRELPFNNETFNLIVFDPPHLNQLGKNSWMAKKYGVLLPTWQTDIKGGFNECWRVLKPGGTLIFKWNQNQIKTNDIIDLIQKKPLFGHTSGKGNNTIWMAFHKF